MRPAPNDFTNAAGGPAPIQEIGARDLALRTGVPPDWRRTFDPTAVAHRYWPAIARYGSETLAAIVRYYEKLSAAALAADDAHRPTTTVQVRDALGTPRPVPGPRLPTDPNIGEAFVAASDAVVAQTAEMVKNGLANIRALIGRIEKEIDDAMATPDAATYGAEIRAWLGAQPPSDRAMWALARARAADIVTLGALVAGPAYLSGLTTDEVKLAHETARANVLPDVHAALLEARNVERHVENAGGSFVKRAALVTAPYLVPVPPQVTRSRAAKDAAVKAIAAAMGGS